MGIGQGQEQERSPSDQLHGHFTRPEGSAYQIRELLQRGAAKLLWDSRRRRVPQDGTRVHGRSLGPLGYAKCSSSIPTKGDICAPYRPISTVSAQDRAQACSESSDKALSAATIQLDSNHMHIEDVAEDVTAMIPPDAALTQPGGSMA